MRLALEEREPSGRCLARTFEPADVPVVGNLLLAAYRGTVDDEGETEADAVAEIDRVVAGEYGPFLREPSFVAVDGGRLVGASLVSLWEANPFLAYLVVHPGAKRRGIGTVLVIVTGNALRSAGHSALELFVTEANEPAVSLYRKLGFRVVDRVTQPPAAL